MYRPQSLPWIEPIALAGRIDEPFWILLYSAALTSYSGRYSYLAFDMLERVEGSDFLGLEAKLSASQPRFSNAWFGYLGYGLKDSLENLKSDAPGQFRLPHLCMLQFATIVEFDHEEHTVTAWTMRERLSLPDAAKKQYTPTPYVEYLASNMSNHEYMEKAACILDHIRAGDVYQANLTRKFYGRFAEEPDPFTMYARLCEQSASPYSAFMRLDDIYVLSSSPELFARADHQGAITTRPIKGTAARHADGAQDAAARQWLANSSKDRAENLMIVDLMRNDLSKSCIPGSIRVDSLHEVSTHSHVHHMSSTISGRIAPGNTTLDAIRHCFPPGSMTGAPKIKAMNLCSELEGQERGLYSGAIGWFGGDGSCELSVVIRTLLMRGSQFEFQVGGGIVSDSTPELELEEIIAKSRGILATLGASPNVINEL